MTWPKEVFSSCISTTLKDRKNLINVTVVRFAEALDVKVEIGVCRLQNAVHYPIRSVESEGSLQNQCSRNRLQDLDQCG